MNQISHQYQPGFGNSQVVVEVVFSASGEFKKEYSKKKSSG
jgi:hypothetical protein